MPCSECKYWQDTSNDTYANNTLGFKKCGRIKEGRELYDQVPLEIKIQRWDNETTEEKYTKVTKELFSKEKAYTLDASDYISYLMTAPDFHCSLFEKEQQNG